MSATRRRVIVVGVDGSDGAVRALEWCAEISPGLDAEIIAVHALSVPLAGLPTLEYPSMPVVDEQWRKELADTVETQWCAAIHDLPHRSMVVEGSPARVLIDVAQETDAAFVVVGSRGRGGFTELLLGSVSHQLSHHVDRPLVIVPPER